jgi:hypothetical protein
MTFEEGIFILTEQNLSMMVFEAGEVVYSSGDRGIKPLYMAYVQPVRFRDALLIDRVIGLGAARLAVKLGIGEVWTKLMSQPARDYLESNGIQVQHETLVQNIQNREGTGFCPVETIALQTLDPQETGFDNMMAEIQAFLKRVGAI